VKRLLIVGCRGMLGTDLMKWPWDDYEIKGVDLEELDIVNKEDVMERIEDMKPDAIINAAAYTDVDRCEGEEELARKVNALGPKYLAVAAKTVGAHFIHISTDYVFDGEKREPYGEWDAPHPINAYGRTKLWGEQLVQQIGGIWTLVRTQWLYGPCGPHFVDKMISLSQKRTTLDVVNDQTGCPTYTCDLVKQLSVIVKQGLRGIVHASSAGSCTWYEFAKVIFELLGKENLVLRPVPSSAYPSEAQRPTYSILENAHLASADLDLMPHWRDGLKGYFLRQSQPR